MQHRTCPMCGKRKPHTPRYFPWDQVRKEFMSAMCRLCRASVRRGRHGKQADTRRDWAYLYKRDAMKGKLAKLGATSASLTADNLRAQMLNQGGVCPVTAEFIELPAGDPTGFNSWSDWLKTLNTVEKRLVPSLVRKDSEQGWEPGNIVFVLESIETFCDIAGSVASAARAMSNDKYDITAVLS